jgi:flagellar assembly factor FliW
MSITIDSTRFGRVEVADEAVIEFPTGLIGLDGTNYTLVAREEDSTFAWLHSLDDPALAIPVVKPGLFFSSYEVEISDEEAARIGVTDSDDAEVYVTVRATEALEGFSANLRAPILIAAGRGHQVINQADGAPLRAPLFGELADAQPTTEVARSAA